MKFVDFHRFKGLFKRSLQFIVLVNKSFKISQDYKELLWNASLLLVTCTGGGSMWFFNTLCCISIPYQRYVSCEIKGLSCYWHHRSCLSMAYIKIPHIYHFCSALSSCPLLLFFQPCMRPQNPIQAPDTRKTMYKEDKLPRSIYQTLFVYSY